MREAADHGADRGTDRRVNARGRVATVGRVVVHGPGEPGKLPERRVGHPDCQSGNKRRRPFPGRTRSDRPARRRADGIHVAAPAPPSQTFDPGAGPATGPDESTDSPGETTWAHRVRRKVLNLFGPKEVDLRRQLEDLESKAATSVSGNRPHYLNRAGDLAMSLGEVDRALHLWGAAIDGYLVSRPDAAAAACRKVLRQAPEVVRAHRTLTLISIGLGHLDEAMAHLRDYVTAARQAERPDLAVQQLRRVAKIASDERFTRRVAEFLVELGDTRGGAKMLAEAARLEEHGAVDPQDRWDAVLRVAEMSPDRASVAERWIEDD